LAHCAGAACLNNCRISAGSAPVPTWKHDADLALDLIETGVTTQPIEIVIAVLTARREGISINAAAKAAGINYRTAQRIVEAAAEHGPRDLAVVS
jgi:hypothetical protein